MKSKLRILGGNTSEPNRDGRTVIGKLKKTSTIIDRDGNHLSSLDPKERQIIKRNTDKE